MENKGQSVVEFALVLPILILLIAGIMEFGLYFNSYLNITFASKEGARIASLDTNATNTTILSAVKSTMPSSSVVELTVSPIAPRITGSPVTVTVSTTYKFMVPMISALIPDKITSSTTMRSE